MPVYTFPGLDAVDFDFSTQSPYIYPALDAVDFDFSADDGGGGDTGGETQTGEASGFMPVGFGLPESPAPIAPVALQAVGFLPARFGTPQLVQFVPGDLTQRGSAATVLRGAKFGRPVSAGALHAPVAGFSPVQFGPVGLHLVQRPPAQGFMPVQFGQAGLALRGHAHGFMPLQLGKPASKVVLPANGFMPARFGTPKAGRGVARPAAQGFAPVLFGTPAAHEHARVSPLLVRVRFGTPIVKRTA